MRELPVAKDCLPYVVLLSCLFVISYFLLKPLAYFFLILLCFVLFFFRNPKRKVPEGKNLIVSPADGVILSITEIDEPEFLKSKAIKISIFLSVFNVHINRCPINGTVKYVHFKPGSFFPAFKSHASELNERNTIGVEGNEIKLLVRQITGFIARRIVCWVKKDDSLKIGERFGLIKFGSCTEIIVPKNVDIKVKTGDKVRGATTIIGVIN